MKRKILIVLLIALIAVFGVASFIVIRDTVRSKTENRANREIADNVESLREQAIAEADQTANADTDNSDEIDSSEHRKPRKVGLLGELGILRWLEPSYEKNNDLAGWIRIPGTVIDYPVMYTEYWPEKYLRTAFDGSWALSGTPFIGANWDPDGNYTVIYGHHMQDGTMFSDLVYYESLDYALAHSKVRFETLYEMYDYEVVFALNTQVDKSTNERTFRYYNYTDLSDPEVFEEYVELARKASLYDTGVDLKVGDRILVLSTCNYHLDDERFIVIARYRPPENDSDDSEDSVESKDSNNSEKQ